MNEYLFCITNNRLIVVQINVVSVDAGLTYGRTSKSDDRVELLVVMQAHFGFEFEALVKLLILFRLGLCL